MTRSVNGQIDRIWPLDDARPASFPIDLVQMDRSVRQRRTLGTLEPVELPVQIRRLRDMPAAI